MTSARASRVELLKQKPAGRLLIHEIYRSIQGESTFAGLPCVFVRLAVCDSRCVWCDTPHAFNQGTDMSLEEVVEKVRGYQCPLVEITGGEPLLQEEVLPLMTRHKGERFCSQYSPHPYLGDVISPPILGWIADRSESMTAGFATVSLMMLVGGVLWLWGARYLARDTELAPTRL